MLYPKNIEEKIGFDKIREMLKEQCSSELGKRFTDKVRFSNKYEVIQRLLSQTDEFLQILQRSEAYPQTATFDLTPSLQKAAIVNNWLEPNEFDELLRTLQTLDAVLNFFAQKSADDYTYLQEVVGKIKFDKKLVTEISKIIDERGKIRDNASPTLQQIRKQLANQEFILTKRLEDLLKDYKKQGYTKEDAEITFRDGRLVVPVNAEYKRTVKGFVHDTSNTGQTVFIEPESVATFNNEVRELQIAERQEIIRILTQLTDKVRPHIENLEKANYMLGVLDFIRAKARLALTLHACKPTCISEPVIEWYQAYHPLLFYNFSKQGRTVIPQTIHLEGNKRLLVISGPNAGGKSVCLKTIGLLQYMLQCGLLVPMKPSSVAGIFEKIFIDIGDDQSLDDDLSTYSSHLTSMKYFIKNANYQTLILIDEFGGGTEPTLGAAIAESILEQLNKQKVLGAITTHYGNLKYFADRTEGIFNGAMRYDVEHLTPLYELELGQPGNSFALEIAQKIGLPTHIIQNARQKVGEKQVSIEKLLGDLEKEKRELAIRNEEIARKQSQLDDTLIKYSALKDEIEIKRKELINKAKAEAEGLLKGANRKIENTIRQIREAQADKEITKQVREELVEFTQAIAPQEPLRTLQPRDEAIEVVGGDLELNCYVQITDTGAIGKVIEINKKDVTVLIGELKSTIKLNRLVRITKKEFKKKTSEFSQTYLNIRPTVGGSGNVDLLQKQTDFSPTLDIRGKRAEEVINILDIFMDEAIMLGHHQLKVIHGKGNGILRDVVRRHLKANYPEIHQMTDEDINRGGNGVTIIMLS